MSFLSKINTIDLKARCKTICEFCRSQQGWFVWEARRIFFQLIKCRFKAVSAKCCIRKMTKHRPNLLPRIIGLIYFIANRLRGYPPFVSPIFPKQYGIAKIPSQGDQMRGHFLRNCRVLTRFLSIFKRPQTDHGNNSTPGSPSERSPRATNTIFVKLKDDSASNNAPEKKNQNLGDYVWRRVHARNCAGTRTQNQSLPFYVATVS